MIHAKDGLADLRIAVPLHQNPLFPASPQLCVWREDVMDPRNIEALQN